MRKGPPEQTPRGKASPPSSGAASRAACAQHAVIASPDHRSFDDAARRLAELAHELSSLLDGSMRTVNLVLSSRGDAQRLRSDISDTDRRLRTVKAALEQMAGMVQSAVRDSGLSTGGARRFARPLMACMTVDDAVTNAVALLEPHAADHAVSVQTQIDPSARQLPAGPVYTVIANALRNAIESLAACSDGRAKRVDVAVTLCHGQAVAIEIADNGVGLPTDGYSVGQPFQPGYTTKPGGAGIGLSLCRDLLMQYGGTVRLEARDDGPGAVLRARYPLNSAASANASRTAA